jgi:hypothetical protein
MPNKVNNNLFVGSSTELQRLLKQHAQKWRLLTLLGIVLSLSNSFILACKSINFSVVSLTVLINCPATSYTLGCSDSRAMSRMPSIASCPRSRHR